MPGKASISTVVEAAVRSGVIASTPQARAQFSDMCRRSPESAWAAVAQKLSLPVAAAAPGSPSQPVVVAATPPVIDDDGVQYPSWFLPRKAALRPSGVRPTRAAARSDSRTARVANDAPRAGALIQAARSVAAAVQRTSQAGRTGYYDPHTLVASGAATDNAARLAAAREADQRRMAAEQAARFGR